MKKQIEFNLNNEQVKIEVNPTKRLLDTLRNDFGLTGVKEGCGEGECGACVVFFDGKIANSCLIPIANVANRNIITIEGFKGTRKFEVIEEAFLKAGSVQCGFCIPGMIMATESVLREYDDPTLEDIKEGLSGNICRCTGYQMIFDAVKIAKKLGGNLW